MKKNVFRRGRFRRKTIHLNGARFGAGSLICRSKALRRSAGEKTRYVLARPILRLSAGSFAAYFGIRDYL